MKSLTLTRIQEIQEKRQSEEARQAGKLIDVPDYRKLKVIPKYQYSKMALYR